jgi:hypothetical protein
MLKLQPILFSYVIYSFMMTVYIFSDGETVTHFIDLP